MADVPPIKVEAIFDDTRFKEGADSAATATKAFADDVDASNATVKSSLTELDTAVDTSTTSMETSLRDVGTTATTELGTTVPKAADDSAVSLTTKGSKFKAVGSELGLSLAEGVSGGMSGPDALANTASSLSGLLATTAKTGAGIAGAVGVGVGVALIAAFIKGANNSRQAFVDAVNGIFDEIEIHAKDSLKDIQKAIIGTFDVQSVITTLGGDAGLEGGLEKIQTLVDTTGVKFEDVVAILQGKMNPRLKDLVDYMAVAVDEGDNWLQAHSTTVDAMSAENKAFSDIVHQGQTAADAQARAAVSAKEIRDTMRDAGRNYHTAADEAERMNAATYEAYQNALKLGDTLGQAASSLHDILVDQGVLKS